MARHRASLIAQLVKNCPAMQETPVWILGWEVRWRKDKLPTPVFLGFPCSSAGKESACNMGYLGSISGLGRSSGEGKGYPLHYAGLENVVHGVAKSWTRLSNFHLAMLAPYVRNKIQTSFNSVQSLSHVWLFAIPCTAACQAFLSFTISWSFLKFMSIESVMQSKHFILCHPLLQLPSIFPGI